MIVLILYITLLNLSGIIKCVFLRNMEPLSIWINILYDIANNVDLEQTYFSYFCMKTYVVGSH